MTYLKQSYKGNQDIRHWIFVFVILTIVMFNKNKISNQINEFCEPLYVFLSDYSVSLVDLLKYCSTEIVLLPFIFFIPKINGRNLLSFITPRPKLDLIKILAIIIVYSVVVLLGLCLELYVDYDFYKLNFDLVGFSGLVIVASLLLTIKAFVTEFVFCAYFTQFFSRFTQNRLIMIFLLMIYYLLSKIYVIPFDDFTIHNVIFFLFIGCFYGVIVLLGDGLEITLGMSFINFLLPAIFVSGGEIPTLFVNTSEEGGLNIFYYISIFNNVCYIIFIIKAFKIKDWKERLGIELCLKKLRRINLLKKDLQ